MLAKYLAKYVTNLLSITPCRSPYRWADFHSHSCSRRKLVWGLWVLRLRETLLIQMNYSDHGLEYQLRGMLDPIVKAPAPPRKGRRRNVLEESRVLDLTVATPAAVFVPVGVFA
jgi:hypothetical protein